MSNRKMFFMGCCLIISSAFGANEVEVAKSSTLVPSPAPIAGVQPNLRVAPAGAAAAASSSGGPKSSSSSSAGAA